MARKGQDDPDGLWLELGTNANRGAPVRGSMKTTACIFIGALFASGQQPAAPAPDSPRPEAVFTVTSTLVQVDAVVTDSKGHQRHRSHPGRLPGLRGRETAEVDSLFFCHGDPGSARRRCNSRPHARNHYSSPLRHCRLRPRRNFAGSVRRTIVLMVDDLGLSFESMANVRASLRKFVNEQMQPGDLVAVCRTGEGSGVCSSSAATSGCCCR